MISDFRVMPDQQELFGLVASVPTAWRTLKEIARGGAGGPADHGKIEVEEEMAAALQPLA